MGKSMSMPGDAEADALTIQLSDRFRDRIRILAMRDLRDRGAAEDVAQETIRRVLEALREGKVRNLDALPGFVFQTARNICLVHRRSAGRQHSALLRFSSGRSEATPEEDDPLHVLIDRERLEGLRRAIDELGEDDQMLLKMCFVEAADTSEIARRLSIEPVAVRVRKHRLLKRLALILRDDAGNDRGGLETV
jgi:RNA polymerase sigma factor (sigma-70 family)